MTGLMEELVKLYENELYSNAKILCQLISAMQNNNRSILSANEFFTVQVILGMSLKDERSYKEAADVLEKALVIRKQLPKVITSDNISDSFIEKFTEPELKYLIAKCFLECKLVNEAVQTLQSLTNKQRTPKINMLLAKTLNDNGKPSMLFYKEVLKECPLAFEAIDGLLNLRVKGSEVNSLVLSASQNCGDWLNNWIKAISQMKERKFDEAIKTLKAIESSSYLKNYSLLLVLIGECHYYNGHYELAYNHLKRAYSLDRNMKRGIQKYAMLLFQLNKVQELEQLVKPLSNFPYEHSTEMWFILAQYLLASGKPEKAIYIVDKACQLDKQNVDAILLKSRIYLQMKKPADALINLRHALKLDCMRYEIHKGIIEVFLSIDKKKEAQQQATAALKHVGESPRTLTLAASTYIKDPTLVNRAKSFLIKALEMNDLYVKAILMLSNIYMAGNEYNEAIKLLEKVSVSVANIKVYLMLGDSYAKKKNQNLAMEAYTKALNIDANNRHALNGLMNLGSSSSNNNNSSTAVLDVSSTSEEISDLQDNSALAINESQVFKTSGDSESESELAWSDIEMAT